MYAPLCSMHINSFTTNLKAKFHYFVPFQGGQLRQRKAKTKQNKKLVGWNSNINILTLESTLLATIPFNTIQCLSKVLILKLKRLKQTLHQHKGNKVIRYHSSHMNREDTRSTDEVAEFCPQYSHFCTLTYFASPSSIPPFFHRHQASLASLKRVKD